MLTFDQRQVDPPDRYGGAKLAVRKERDVAVHRAEPGDEPVSTGGHVGGRLAVGAAVAPYIPVRALLANLHRPLALKVAVGPFGQRRLDLARRAASCELAGSAGAQPRTDQDPGELDLLQALHECTRLVLAASGQG